MSQYIANLNTIPSAHDLESQQQEDYSLEDDLALFTNTEFFDFDARGNIEQTLVNYDAAQGASTTGENVAAKYNNDDVTGLDLNNSMCTLDFFYITFLCTMLLARVHLLLPCNCNSLSLCEAQGMH